MRLLFLLLCFPLCFHAQDNIKFNRPDSVQARYILLANENYSIDSAYTTLGILRSNIRDGALFTDLAFQYSNDKLTSKKGGYLGWFKEGVMVPEFNEACFTANIGDLVIVYTRFGTCLIHIIDTR